MTEKTPAPIGPTLSDQEVVQHAVLVVQADRDGPLVLWIGAWPEPLGISLVADRLSALLLLVSAVVSLAVLLVAWWVFRAAMPVVVERLGG